MATNTGNPVLIRGSNTSGVTPSSLTQGSDDTESTAGASTEIAINRADGKLFYLNASDQVTEFSGGGSGDITGVTAGVGLSGGGSSGGVTLTLDMSELTDMTQDINSSQDELILLDNGADRKKLISEIPLSAFDNDSGFTTNTGDITGVDLTGGTGVTISSESGTTSGNYSSTIAIGQAVGTSDAVTFATVNTGQGANELYDMDQNVKTTNSPTFVGLTLTGDLAVNGDDITCDGNLDIVASGALHLDSADELKIDSNAGDIRFQDGGVTQLTFDLDGTSGEIRVQPAISNDDLVFLCQDGDESLRLDNTQGLKIGGTGATVNQIRTSFNDDDTSLLTCQGIKEKIENYGYTTNTGDVTASSSTTFTNKTFNANGTGNSLSNVEVADLASSAIQTSSASFTDSDTVLMTAAAIQDKILAYGYSTTTGDITAVTAGNALSGGGSSGAVTINLDDPINLSELTESSDATDDKILLWDESASAWKYMTIDNLQDSIDTTGGGGGTVNTADIADVSVTQTELAELETIGSTTISSAQWGYVGGADQALTTGDDASFTRLQVTGTGTIDVNNGYVQIKGDESTDGRLMLFADEGDDNADKWEVQATTAGLYEVNSKNSGAYVNMMSLTNAAQMTLGQINAQNGRYQVVSGANVLNGVTGTFDIPTDFAYDAMANSIHVIGSQTITVTGGIITNIG